MGRFNLIRPLLIIGVAYLSYNSTELILLTLGKSEDVASNFAVLVMLICTVICFYLIKKNSRRPR